VFGSSVVILDQCRSYRSCIISTRIISDLILVSSHIVLSYYIDNYSQLWSSVNLSPKVSVVMSFMFSSKYSLITSVMAVCLI
jgi:hypothetical protein